MQKAAKNHDDKVDEEAVLPGQLVEHRLPAWLSAVAEAGSLMSIGTNEASSITELCITCCALVLQAKKATCWP